jgi:membrane protein DedA with SNARE-associated domain/membrane-associated phospholipid phosphatase
MEAWINDFTNWIPIGGLYYSLLGLLAFVESLAFIGIICPGSILIVFTGFLAANGKGDLVILATIYSLGAIAGDLVSYVLGARAGGAIMQRPWFKRRENLLNKAQLYFAAHGGKSVFIGRFVGFLRPFIPFIAGSARMNPLAFTLYALVSGVLWGISYPGLGYLCGASWQMVQVWSGRFSLLLLLLAVIFILNALLWRYLIPWLGKLGRRMGENIASAWQKLLTTPAFQSFCQHHPRFWLFLCQRFTAEHASGICLTVGLTISTLFAALFAWFGRGIQLSSALSHFDQRLYDLLAILHHPWTDLFFAALTWMGSGPAMIILGAFALFALIINNRDFSALILVFGMASGELFAALIKEIFDRPRPIPLFPGLNTIGASFPSGHAFSALLFYGLVVYFLIGTTRNWRAKIIFVFIGSFVVLLVGFSRIFLGVHWTSDVLAGFTLAALWLTFLITLCETRFRYGGFGLQRGWRPFKFTLRTRLALLLPAAIVTAGLVSASISPYLRTVSLERAEQTHKIIAASDHLSAQQTLSADLPKTTQSLWGHPLRPLSLIVVADESALQQRLAAAGWRPATRAGLVGFKTLLIDLLLKRPQSEATIVPQLVEGQMQDFSLVRANAEMDTGSLHSLLVWDLGRRLVDGRTIWGLLVVRQIGVKHLFVLPLPLPLIVPARPDEEAQLTAAFAPNDSDAVMLIRPLSSKQKD